MRTSKKKNRLKVLLFDLSRIKEWWILSLTFVFFGFIPHIYRINDDTITLGHIMDLFTSPPLYIALIVVFTAQIFLFASNDYFDSEIDALDRKKRRRNPVCNGNTTPKAVKILLAITAIIPLLGAFYFNIPTVLFTAFTILVFYFYTAKPLRFKSRVGLDVLSHGVLINTFPYFFVIVALLDFHMSALYLLAALMLRSAMAQILQEVRDHDVDKKVERNTVIALGQRGGIRLAFSLYLTLTLLTIILLVTEQLYDVGITMHYSIVLILCITYMPTFIRLLRIKNNYSRTIERLWVGQGRATFANGFRYMGSFALYFCLIFFFPV